MKPLLYILRGFGELCVVLASVGILLVLLEVLFGS
jgi:hypothetical protein